MHDSWPDRWSGLPQVLEACIAYLDLQHLALTPDVQKLLAASREIADQLEQLSLNAVAYAEPRYHNRLHTADVLASMTLLVAIETQLQSIRSPDWCAAALLAAVAHDFAHPGRVNSKPSELEESSMLGVLPILKKHQVKPEWVECISHVVLRSDFALVAENHRLVEGQSFAWHQDWLAVLLNEADILASSVSVFGESLGHALSDEWHMINFPPFATVATADGRRKFLQSLKFSSNASRILGVQERITAQLMR
ncbi:MAG: hypothetical protein KGN99_04395 [Pseudomonadota bacterium]|nr:hypothetical protein [Pseudomonadota bacterium]